MAFQDPPLVSIGVPVFNGEMYLADSLDSLLAQDHPNLEILISDNASTDGTGEICESYARRDPRVRYVRQDTNIGSTRNFEFVFEHTRGDYFYWQAHDDLRHPTFTSRCLAELQNHPGAVLCNSAVQVIDEAGSPRPDWEDLNFSTVGLTVLERLHRLYDHMDWVDMMGLARRDALAKALPFEGTWGGDVLISAKLLLQGDFCKVDAPLFQYRVREVPKGSEQTLKECFDEGFESPKPYTAFAQTWLRILLTSSLGIPERRWLFTDFLKTLVRLTPQGPHPCWRDILRGEHPSAFAVPNPPAFSAFLADAFFPLAQSSGLALGGTATEHLAASARTVLLWIPGGLPEHEAAGPFFSAVRKALPDARLILVCPIEALEAAEANPDLDDLIGFDLRTFALDSAFRQEITDLVGTLDIDLLYCAALAHDPLLWPLVQAAKPLLAAAHQESDPGENTLAPWMSPPYDCLLPPSRLGELTRTVLPVLGLSGSV
ncbi:hypothetical protein GETHOR_28160 [Geothrix oryzae]|uniref:Glycosyltransferase 2-like domain-containing protein n=1 Tax=Geothrix oryzae TaxID=2927975 RepID=A0ABN6VA82_9BACT|nr:glycosyltransferase [Geothrix oryzae]BDU70715.1 hypothetical protein GETHOR_28160 [Geothrix oryzae]